MYKYRKKMKTLQLPNYQSEKEFFLNNKLIHFVTAKHKNDENEEFFIKNMDKIREQILLFKHIDYFKKFEKTHPEIYLKIKNGFDLVLYNASLGKPMSDTDNILLLNVISNKTSLANNLINKAIKKIDDNLIRKNAHTNVFSDDIFLVKEIFYNTFFNTNTINKELEKQIFSQLLGNKSAIDKITDFFRKNVHSNLSKVKNNIFLMREQMTQAESILNTNDTKNDKIIFQEDLFVNMQKSMVEVNTFLAEKRKNLPATNMIENNFVDEFEKVPEFFISLSLFLLSTSVTSEKILNDIGERIKKIASQEDKDNAMDFLIKYYCALSPNEIHINNQALSSSDVKEILEIRHFENEVKNIRVDSLDLQDKGELMFQNFLKNDNKNPLLVSEYLREISGKLRTAKLNLLLPIKDDNNQNRNKRKI